MPALDHPPLPDEPRDPPTERRNARIGLHLFRLYFFLYAGFVGINAFAPSLMDRVLIEGINTAVVSGFSLIAGAFGIALLYVWLCRKPAGAQ